MTAIRKAASLIAASLMALTATAEFANALTCTPMSTNPDVTPNTEYDGRWIISWQGYDCVVTVNSRGVFDQRNCNVSGTTATNAIFKGKFSVNSQCNVTGNFRITATQPTKFDQNVIIKSATLRAGSATTPALILGVAGYNINRVQLIMIQTQ